ncbi:MAG: ABA4-like family protein [Proteobacteria bacterium]|nr:ABA4-like family protein [Pseudomonadota bacterium]
MDKSQIFQLANAFAMLGWLALIFMPNSRITHVAVHRFLIQALLALLYAGLVVQGFQWSDMQAFSQFDGVLQLFQRPDIVLPGWIHYLSFDLFIGAWIAREAKLCKIHHVILVPCLILTLQLGPIGLICFLIIRFWHEARQRKRAEAARGAV